VSPPDSLAITVRVYEEANAYLPESQRKKPFTAKLAAGADVRALLAHLEIPEEAVDLALVNGESAEPGRILEDGDRVAVYPVFETLDIQKLSRLPRSPLRNPAFAAMPVLSGLKQILRLLGFDVLDLPAGLSHEGVEGCNRQRRILLTASRANEVSAGWQRRVFLEAEHPEQQAVEVMERLHLWGRIRPFCRCPSCNRVIAKDDGNPAGEPVRQVLCASCRALGPEARPEPERIRQAQAIAFKRGQKESDPQD
jgi:hypothetical protein